MLTYIKSLFKSKVKSEESISKSDDKEFLVFFDQDQIRKGIIKNICSRIDMSRTRVVIVSTNRSTPNPNLPGIEFYRANSIAKEAADVAMTVFTVQEIERNKNLKEVHYFTSDADSVGAAFVMATMYTSPMFFINSLSNRPKSKRLIKELPKNVIHRYIKEDQSKSK